MTFLGGLDITTRTWRSPRVVTCLMIVQFLCLTTLLGLVGYANPDTYRTQLWKDGISNNLVNATYTDTPALVWQPRCLSLQSHPTPPLTVSRATTISLYLVLISFLVLVLQAVGFILSLLGPLVTGAINIVLIVVHIALVTIFQAGAGAEVERQPCR